MRITEEQIERANSVSLPSFLMSNGFALKKVGREYSWKEHDSLHIKDNAPGERGSWFRFSEDKGGDNIAFVREFMGKSFVEAVEMLNGESYVRDFVPSHSYEQKPKNTEKLDISILENADSKRVFGYLCGTRGLDYDLIASLVRDGKIVQEQKTGNAVFKIFDENNTLVGAEKVGTSTEHKFKSIATGSASGYGFEVCKGDGENAMFFESAIDMLSYLQMYGSQLENHRLVSMMGVKPSIVIDTMERYGISHENVFICSDNDKAGNDFAGRLMSEYPQMKRVFTDSRYKDWNDMLRDIPKEKEEVGKVVTYGNKTWNDATDNRNKTLVSMNEDTFTKLKFNLDASGINYFAYAKNNSVVMAVNDKDIDWLKQIAGNENLPTRKSNVEYIPPQKNIIGNAEYRYIPDKKYTSADSDTALKMAEIMLSRNVQFSGRIYPNGKATLTVSGADLAHVQAIQQSVIDMRKQFARDTKADEVIGNKAYRDIRQRQIYYSRLTPEQYKEVQPYLDTNAEYSGLIRDNKVIFTVEKDDSAAFHRALENAQREVGIINALKENGIDGYRLEKLSAVIHRFAVEDIHESLEGFFTPQLDEKQFDKMLSLVNDYLAQAVSERYGEHSGLNAILDFKNEIDRTAELTEFFSEHSFSDEQKTVIAEMFAKDSSKANVEVIDETFTPDEIREYYDILHNQLDSGDVAEFLDSHRQAKADSLSFRFGDSENKAITAFAEANPDCSFALANAVMMFVGKDVEKQQEKADWQEQSEMYQKSYFDISAKISGEFYSFSGAVYINDAKNVAESTIIEHIRSFSEQIIAKGGSPVAEDKETSLRDAQRNLDTLVPFLEANLQLTAEEERIFAEFIANYEKSTPEISDNATLDPVGLKSEESLTSELPEFTDKEKAFLSGDIVPFMVKSVLSWDEVESIGYRFYEDGYINKYAPHENFSYGNGLSEVSLYDFAQRMQDGEDIRKELSKALLGNQHNFITSHDNEFTVEYGEDDVTARYGNAESHISYEDLGDAFFKLFKDEYNDIVHSRTVEDLRDIFPDITDETADKLINAFDGARMHGWNTENSLNTVKINRIKKALYDILGDEENTEKAFASIADMKYNFKVERKQQDSLSFSFRKDEESWFTESDVLYDFVTENPDVSFALANAVMEYLDEKQHSERDIPELNAGWYKKTDFTVNAVINGEQFGYEGRFDIGDGKGTGGGSIIDHIRTYTEGIIERGGSPFASDKSESLKNAHSMLDVFIPFLEQHSQLTAEEQRIFDDFKAKNPVRTFDDYAAEQGYFHIYQLKDDEKSADSELNKDDYDHIYTGRMVDIPNDDKLEGIHAKFNWETKPLGFNGHNMREPDVVVTDVMGELKAYRCNGDSFDEMPEFFAEKEPVIDTAVEQAEKETEVKDMGSVTMRKVGSFYEMYGKNAQIAADILGLHITSKNGEDMVGFPDSVKSDYSDKLREAGYFVMVEEVFELNPPKRDVPEKTVDLMSDISEVAETVPEEAVNPLTITFNGDSDSLDKIKDKALSLGATCTLIASGLVVDTYENHRDELLSAADELGLESKIRGEETTDISVDDDIPLFTDADVIEEIEKSEKASDDKPFWETPVTQGEQLSLFGDSIPLTANEISKKDNVFVDEGLFVGNVNRFTALHDEIMRGTGFQDGKLRVKRFYDEKKPENKEFSDFLKNEYGTGGHTGDGEIGFVDHDSKGMYFTLRTGEKFRFTWAEVAKFTAGIIDNGKYITRADIDNSISYAKHTIENTNPESALDVDRIKLEQAHKVLQEYGIETENASAKSEKPTTIEVGDKFRNKMTGEISEVISLSGVLPWYTDDCTVRRESGGFEITENISIDKLLDEKYYERVTDVEIEKAVSEKKEPVKADTESPDKNDSFIITDDSLGNGGAKTKFKNNISAIEMLKMLEESNVPANIEAKEILSKYVGWGGIFQAFDKENKSWENEYAQLKELLTDKEYSSARASVLDAFFTSPTVIDAIYEALGNFGFKSGNVLEPAMGVGNFFGRMPENMRVDSKLYGVEIDSISGRIAQQLYPYADIAVKGFEHNTFQDGCFDVAVGNVPFGELGFTDSKHQTAKLHDFFFAETMDKIKPGGIVAFVTSAGTLDKRDDTVRRMLAEKADFIGAIRLPGGKNGAFKDNAGTEVTADIIFLQKKGGNVPEREDKPDWISIGETIDGLPINNYFAENPDMVLGTVIEGNKLYGSGTMVIANEGADLKEQLHTAVSKLSATISDDKARDVYAKTAEGKSVKIPSNLRNYSFFAQDNNIYFKVNNVACHFRFDTKNSQFKRTMAFIRLRDLTRELIEAQEHNKPDSVITDLQAKLNDSYDDFYKKYGLIHSQSNKRYFSEDVSYNLVASLEKEYEKTELKEKSDIFFKRTIQPPKAVEQVETAIEALTLSIAEKAGVDFEYMGSLTGMTEEELKHDLQGEIYKVPHTENTYQTASEYLSGDIRKKLRIAEEIAEYDADFAVNVNALKAVIPTPLKAGDIDVKLGATWLDPKYYEQFMYEIFRTPRDNRADVNHSAWQRPRLITAEYSEHSGSWHIANKSQDRSVIAMQQFGSKQMGAYDILEHLLNLKEPKVYKTIEVPDGMGDVKEKRVVDIDATRVVQKKADKIRDEFKKWIFKDPTRREEIVAKYNELFNSVRPREYDGSALKFPMMNSDITLHEHQKNAIAHAMFGGNTLFAHCVGAGKSATRS